MSDSYKAMTLEAMAQEGAGNWRKFPDFCWYDQPDNPNDWMIYHLDNRDSGILEQSNAEAARKRLATYVEDIVPQSFGHWACGWIDALAVRVFWGDGEITDAFKELYSILKDLEDYPLLDEDDYSKREHDVALANISDSACGLEHNGPVGWESEVFSWLWDNCDDRGAYPSTESIERALKALGYCAML